MRSAAPDRAEIKMPKKKTPELKPEEQFKRFVEAAEKLGADATKVESTFASLSRSKHPQDGKKRAKNG